MVIVLFEEILIIIFFVGRHREFIIYVIARPIIETLLCFLGELLVQKVERDVYRTYSLTLLTINTSTG